MSFISTWTKFQVFLMGRTKINTLTRPERRFHKFLKITTLVVSIFGSTLTEINKSFILRKSTHFDQNISKNYCSISKSAKTNDLKNVIKDNQSTYTRTFDAWDKNLKTSC